MHHACYSSFEIPAVQVKVKVEVQCTDGGRIELALECTRKVFKRQTRMCSPPPVLSIARWKGRMVHYRDTKLAQYRGQRHPDLASDRACLVTAST